VSAAMACFNGAVDVRRRRPCVRRSAWGESACFNGAVDVRRRRLVVVTERR